MTTHRRLGMDFPESVAAVAVQAAKAQRRSETASTGAVSRLRYETEKRSQSEVESIDLDDIRALFEDGEVEPAEDEAATIIDEDEEEV